MTSAQREAPRPLAVDATNAATRRILAVAAEIFDRLGFQKATIADVVAGAKVSRPLFYRRFRDKQHLFEVVVDRLITEWNETLVDEVTRTRGGAAEELRVLHEVSLEYGRDQPLLHRLLTRDTQLLLATESDVIERGSAALRELITQILRRGRAAGEVRPDIAIDAMADFLTEVHLAYTDRVVITGAPLADDLVQGVLDCMLGAVLSGAALRARTEQAEEE
jgi:AcrR family transcriptional regulator